MRERRKSLTTPQSQTETDELYMRAALREAARAAAKDEVPVGAVVVKNGRIIAKAHNKRERSADPSAHAEFIAMVRAAKRIGNWRLDDCTLYVTLEPCPMCAGAISQARIERLVFGAYDAAMGCTGSVYRIPEDPAFGHFCRSEGGVLREECEKVIKEFFDKARRG